MKKIFPLLLLFLGTSSLVHASETWTCQGSHIQNLVVSNVGGKFSASLSWDCAAGADACKMSVENLQVIDDGLHGNTRFEGPDFSLGIDNDVVRNDGCPGGVSAISQGPKEAGGGITLVTAVHCQLKIN